MEFPSSFGPCREVPCILLLLLFHTQFPLSGENAAEGEIVLFVIIIFVIYVMVENCSAFNETGK